MASLLALLSQQTPNLKTRKGLILLGLQNDFVDPKGKLPVKDTGFVDRIIQLVPAFREFGDVIWVRSEFESNRPVNGFDTPGDTVIAGGFSGRDEEVPSSFRGSRGSRPSSSKSSKRLKSSPKSTVTLPRPDDGENDEELFLTRTSTREPCCVRGSRGAEYADRIKPLVRPGKDMQVVKSHYSAFGATSLLLTLRSNLITELYVCGNITNLSVYATAMDAARYGIRIILITDCLGYRRQDRHKQAIKQLQDLMEADVIKSDKVIDELREQDQDEQDDGEDESEDSQYSASDNALEADSEESEDEVSLPIVGRSGMLNQWIEQRSYKASGRDSPSPAPAQECPTRTQRAPPSDVASQPTAAATPRPSRPSSSRSFHASTATKESQSNKSNDNTPDSSRHQRRIDISDSLASESPQSQKEPWLDLIPHSSSPAPLTFRPKHPGLAALSEAANLSPSTVAEYEEMMERAQTRQDETSIDARSKPLFGEGKEDDCAGSRILYDLLPPHMADIIFKELDREVKWQTMYHQTGEVPRLVCCQGTIDEDGSMPVYRHPSDQTMPLQTWTLAVDRVRKAVEKITGHPLNHGLIQLYRAGTDFISEHSDKTLDITPGSSIVNVSFGAQRTMRLRTKRSASAESRTTYRVPMPHNSMITMSLETNAQYLHGITADKRPAVELLDAEKAYDGQRISLTFRNIGTYLSSDSSRLWGQGAVAKTKKDARRVINGDAAQSEKLTRAFGAENQASKIAWEDIYGDGFDVLHLKAVKNVVET